MVGEGAGPVWAYDTFDGVFPLLTVGEGENPSTYEVGGQSSPPSVKDQLEQLGVTCVKGVFPCTFFVNRPKSVSFVHVDMDTYMATKAALELFHPLMTYYGVFLIHDYDNESMGGVKKAVDEFAATDAGRMYDHDSFVSLRHTNLYQMRKRPSQEP